MAPGTLLDDLSSSERLVMPTIGNTKDNLDALPGTRPTQLNIQSLPLDKVTKLYITMTPSALGTIDMPVFAYRSSNSGPTIGITSTVHGNEVNGIFVIEKLFESIANSSIQVTSGTIIGVPVVNVPGFLASIRCFDDESKQDLNRLMPGKKDGAAPQQYTYRFFHNIVTKFDYLVDLHTASLGRRNSLYVRADMSHPVIAKLAQLMKPQVLVHVATGGSLRGCAQANGIPALTVEIGNPSCHQPDFVHDTFLGICRVMANLRMLSKSWEASRVDIAAGLNTRTTAVCTRSYWVFSQQAGILKVFKNIADRIQPGELLAEIKTIFGESVEKIYAPLEYETVVVGIEANPVAKCGNRVIHLGVVGSSFATVANDGHL